MGNCQCQASAAAAVEVEHADGRRERLYWPVSARQLMLQNPGHYVAVFSQQLPGCTVYANHSYFQPHASLPRDKPRLKLMPPDATLVLGSCYRLVSFEEAVEFSQGTKSRLSQHWRRKVHPSVPEEGCRAESVWNVEEENVEQEGERDNLMCSIGYGRPRQQWRPALQSIAEVGW